MKFVFAILVSALVLPPSGAAFAQDLPPIRAGKVRSGSEQSYGHPYDIPADPYGIAQIRRNAKAAHKPSSTVQDRNHVR